MADHAVTTRTVQPGDRYIDQYGQARVMAVAEGYAMMR